MRHTTEQQTCERLVSFFGVERIISFLPQHEVRQAFDLVSVRELAESVAVNYDTFRSRMYVGRIAFPKFLVQRRAYFTREQAEEIKQNWQA